ncbi:MAG: hypothetical protein LCH20_05745, partial [Proteobacteria bacterium]|nr:hypothetical protein [Pseudomonadota bacterium]
LPDTTSRWGGGNAAGRVGIDKEEYQHLYEVGYHHTLSNKLVAKLKDKLSQSTSPVGAKIFISDVCSDPKELGKVLGLLQNDLKGESESINKMVLILPLSIKGHAHSLVIHIDNILTRPTVHVIFKDPYGVVNDPEKHTPFYEQIRSFVQEIRPEALMHRGSDEADLQGRSIDLRNCAPLNIYCLGKFLDYALTDADPRDYKIDMLFDVLSSDKCDRVRNDAIHYAFVLRLKALQLKSIELGDQDLVFQIKARENGSDPEKTKIVEGSVEKLLTKILETSKAKLISYCGDKALEKFNSLALLEQIKLFNLISEQVVLQQSWDLINPSGFSRFIDRIIDNFETKIDSAEMKALRERAREMEDCLNGKPSLGFEEVLAGVIQYGLDEVSKKCIRFMPEREVLGFIDKLADSGIDKGWYKQIITELLDFIVCKWCATYSQEFISYDEKGNLRSQILSKLLSEGADPHHWVHSLSAFENISWFGSLPLVRVLLKFYPDKLSDIFCLAVEGKNAAVVNHLRDKFIKQYCEEKSFEQIQKLLLNHPVLMTDFVLVKWGIKENIYTEPMIQSCLKSLLGYGRELQQEESAIHFPSSNNPKRLEEIRCKEKEIAAIKKILEAKLAKLVPLKPSTTSGFKRAHDDERDDEGSDHDQKHSRLDGTEDTLLMGADI